MNEQSSWRDTLLRTVALLGLIVVLLLGAWGIILLAFNLSSVASTVGGSLVSLVSGNPSHNSGGEESLAIAAPASVTSAAPVTLSWNHENASGQYSYTVSYECQSGLSLKAPTPAGQYQAVPCATPFNYTGAAQSMTVIPTVTGKTPVAATFVVSATRLDDGAVTASASADVTVNPATSAPAQNTGSGSSSNSTGGSTASNGGTYIPAAHPQTLYGYPDLSVSIISVTQIPTFAYPGRTQVQFSVSNIGTNIARAGWNFSAQLPLQAPYGQYTSQTQQALYPGDKIVYTLTFDNQSSYNTNNYNQVCTLQYPNYNCNNGYNNQYPYNYNQYQYGNYQTCYNYNGYQNVAVPCRDSNGNIIYQNNYQYGYNQNYGYQYPTYGRTVTITVDPQNYILESNEANNTVTTQAF